MSIISKESFNKFSEEEKRKVRELNKELSTLRNENGDKYHYLTGSLDNLNALFGKENLQPEPKIKTWVDVKKLLPEDGFCVDVFEKFADNPKITLKCQATLKIAKLIELGYGGMVTDEEWRDDGINKFSIVCEANRLSIVCLPDERHFISFHYVHQAEEFMSYTENVELVKQYNLI